jgi:hypothetical protein
MIWGWHGSNRMAWHLVLREVRPPLRFRQPKAFTIWFALGELSAQRSARMNLKKACHSRLLPEV